MLYTNLHEEQKKKMSSRTDQKATQNATISYQKNIHALRKWRVAEKLKAYKVPVMLNLLDDQCGCMSEQEIFASIELPTHKHLTPLETSSDIIDIWTVMAKISEN